MRNYVAVVDVGTAFPGEKALSKPEITDDESQVILLLESRRHAVIWTKPADVGLDDLISRLTRKNPSDPNNVRHNQVGGMHALLANGKVRFITENVTRQPLREIILRGDGKEPGSF